MKRCRAAASSCRADIPLSGSADFDYNRHEIRARAGEHMEFTALFLANAIVMLTAWYGRRRLSLALFALTLAASVATLMHHASDVLNLSF